MLELHRESNKEATRGSTRFGFSQFFGEFYRENVKKARIVVSESFGLSSARNKGIMESSGDIIAFIDDAWAEEDWIGRIARNFENGDVFGVGGEIIPVFYSKRPKWAG
jgi:glycosyltransferase involved in cell wall biosynthesis